MLDAGFVRNWNKNIDKLASNKKVQESLEHLYDLNVTISTLKHILFQAIANIPETTTAEFAIEPKTIQKCVEEFMEYDDKVAILCDLSVLELSLIIAMKHHSEIYDRDPFNFEMILTRLHKFQNSTECRENYDRTIVLKAFEVLKVRYITNVKKNELYLISVWL